jgi:hypothetical protein
MHSVFFKVSSPLIHLLPFSASGKLGLKKRHQQRESQGKGRKQQKKKFTSLTSFVHPPKDLSVSVVEKSRLQTSDPDLTLDCPYNLEKST